MANPDIQRRMHRIVRRSGLRPERALEVGDYVGDKSLLRFKEIRKAERWCINLVEQPDGTGIKHVGSANDMHMFKDHRARVQADEPTPARDPYGPPQGRGAPASRGRPDPVEACLEAIPRQRAAVAAAASRAMP